MGSWGRTINQGVWKARKYGSKVGCADGKKGEKIGR